MKNYYAILMLIIALVGNELAGKTQPVDEQLLIRKANYIMNRYFPEGIRKISDFRSIKEGNLTLIHVLDIEPEGWILLSADQRVDPVIGFGFKGRYEIPEKENLDPRLTWMNHYKKQINIAIRNNELPRHSGWERLSLDEGRKKSASALTVAPLIKANWNQSRGWNTYCPETESGPGGRAYAGCVAVSMAQAMSVYNFPPSGTGSHSYYSQDFGTQYANFGSATYHWDSMSLVSPDEHNALILFHCGVSVDMDYGSDGSGSFTTKTSSSLKKYFLYSANTERVFRDNDNEKWKEMLNNELKNGRPIIYSGDGNDGKAGHAFNIDGVLSGNYYHLNWGWSGANNGHYTFNDLTPGANNYNYDQKAIFGIQPKYYPTDVMIGDTAVPIDMIVGAKIGIARVIDEAENNIYSFEVICDSLQMEDNSWVPDYYFDVDTLKTNRVFSPQEEGPDTIVVKVTDMYDHTISKEIVLNINENYSNTVSIKNYTYSELNVYPNPAGNLIQFKTGKFNKGNLRIISIDGKLAYYRKELSDGQQVDISGLNKGLYYIEFSNGNSIAKAKFIKL